MRQPRGWIDCRRALSFRMPVQPYPERHGIVPSLAFGASYTRLIKNRVIARHERRRRSRGCELVMTAHPFSPESGEISVTFVPRKSTSRRTASDRSGVTSATGVSPRSRKRSWVIMARGDRSVMRDPVLVAGATRCDGRPLAGFSDWLARLVLTRTARAAPTCGGRPCVFLSCWCHARVHCYGSGCRTRPGGRAPSPQGRPSRQPCSG